ncbi:LOW QUALITY PROTEIN: kinesin-like protein KIN-10A [Dioscorea cayenensis subsp. rotundata]|uniref:Kinesin-like protein KIN-10A n=1 Tax=Dioscorea cayennensis subsp. rotundata TaxID=55577 RepID=A0AB40B5N6_DIOCR|nr:LOW QUALITY PROTEIN: kinesin-like protein KIN-10A [Dioscorea cayenensis subsp. rotundata]
MAPTPSPRPLQGFQTPTKTPQSKHRLQFPSPKTSSVHPSPNPLSAAREPAGPTEHPVEVIGRIRDYPDRKDKPLSALEIAEDGSSVRVRTDIGYRDFSLDGVSVSEDENLEGFYKKFVESRIAGVRVGAKCTIMMYGPTGAGKSHTMFGCSKEPGIVYRALRDILGDEDGENGVDDGGFRVGLFVQVAVLEIYNEEIYDLLSGNSNGGGTSSGLPKGNTPKVRLEVMGKKAKNASYISGNEAGKISKEVAKVEKRRIVKSTLCNERSSRSHCLIILDVPAVGGRLMLVDMAGSENIEQAGQLGLEAKMQTAKINQGNIALKRVVESIANGDSHVPFRDSKLTMLLQDSFEDDKSKILMILCASPDPKELHKTISTLEYGAKAKCIVRAAHIATPKEKTNHEESSVLLRSRIVAMNQFIYKLQLENKLKEKERDEAHKELLKKEEELLELRNRLKLIEGRGSTAKEDEIKSKVDERTQLLKVEMMKMEERMLKQQEELHMLRQRLEEMESAKSKVVDDALHDIDGGSRFMKRLSEIYAEGDQGMEKSMELDFGEPQIVYDEKEIKEDLHQSGNYLNCTSSSTVLTSNQCNGNATIPKSPSRFCLSTVFEGEEEGEEMDNSEGDEVEKEVVEDTAEHGGQMIDDFGCSVISDYTDFDGDAMEMHQLLGAEVGCSKNPRDVDSARKTRIQNIFRLCGNYRELAQQVKTPLSSKKANNKSSPFKGSGGQDNCSTDIAATESPISDLVMPLSSKKANNKSSPFKDLGLLKGPISDLVMPFTSLHLEDDNENMSQELKEDHKPVVMPQDVDDSIEVFVKWEASKEFSGNIITKLKVLKDSTLSDLRKLIEVNLEEDNNKQSFTFLLLGDPSGVPISREKEATIKAIKLPTCNNQPNVHLACLRLIKKAAVQRPNHIPFSSLENTLPVASSSPSTKSQFVEAFSPKTGHENTNYLTGLKT